MRDNQDVNIPCVSPIASYFNPTLIPAEDIVISSDRVPDMNGACLVIFTSGTTGPPKGVVQPRSYLTSYAGADAAHYNITENDTVLHVVPVHHATGVGLTLLPFFIVGACIEFRSSSFDAARTWERWRQGGLTFFSGVPTMYMRMMRHYEETIAKKPPEVRDQYIAGARGVRVMLCGTSALSAPVEQFWRELRNKPILTRYGCTEFGTVLKTDPDSEETPPNSVGRPVAGVSLKLTSEGHLLVKSPYMFSKYVHFTVLF